MSKKKKKGKNKKGNFWGTSYKREGGFVELKLFDESEGLIEKWKWNTRDIKTSAKVFRILREKYNVYFKPEVDKHILGKDLYWLKK